MKIKCLVCGKSFDYLPPHIARAHGISALEYRDQYQLPAGKPLCSESYSAMQSAKMLRMMADGVLTHDHLPEAVAAAKGAGRGSKTAAELALQAERARSIPRNRLPPGAKRADGRDADKAREYQRAKRAALK